jgi:hypothetical protein
LNKPKKRFVQQCNNAVCFTNADKKALNIHVPPDLASVFEAGAILKNSDKKRGQKGVRFLRRAV